MNPLLLGSIITAGAGLLGQLLGGGGGGVFIGQPIQYQPMISPQEQALRNAIAQRMMAYLNMQVPPVPSGIYDASNILYNVFLGRQAPGYNIPMANIPRTPMFPMNYGGFGINPFQYNLRGGGAPQRGVKFTRGLAR